MAAGILPGVRFEPRTIFRGLGKFVAVAVAAGLCGAGIGVVLAEVTGGEDSSGSPATKAATTTTNRGEKTQTTATVPKGSQPAKVAVLVAQLGRTSPETDRARLIVRTRVTNLRDERLEPVPPVLVSGDDRVELDDDARDGAGPLLDTLGAGESAVGVLKFTLPADVTQRVTDDPRARLRIAGQTVTLKIRKPQSSG